MPVICHVPVDPTDLVIQGELMRRSAIASGVHAGGAPLMASAQVRSELWLSWLQLPGQSGVYPPMHPAFTDYHSRLRNSFAGTMIANNACIATPCGTLIPMDPCGIVLNRFEQADVRWQLVGVTRDSAGAALGTCDVIVMEVGRLAVDGAPIVARTTSDGSGNYTVEVPLNIAYQVISYKTGSPDVAGITLNTLTPVAV